MYDNFQRNLYFNFMDDYTAYLRNHIISRMYLHIYISAIKYRDKT